MPIIEFKNVNFNYPHAQPILTGFSMQIEAGEKILITGRNGVGKTTLIKLMSNTLLPQSGSVALSEKNIGILLSGPEGFFPNLTGKENLLLFAALFNKELTDMDKWCELAVFKSALDTPFQKCSQGMKKVLALYRTFFTDYRLVFLDEPVNFLDTITQQWLISYFDNFNGTLIIASHLNFAFSGRQICLD